MACRSRDSNAHRACVARTELCANLFNLFIALSNFTLISYNCSYWPTYVNRRRRISFQHSTSMSCTFRFSWMTLANITWRLKLFVMWTCRFIFAAAQIAWRAWASRRYKAICYIGNVICVIISYSIPCRFCASSSQSTSCSYCMYYSYDAHRSILVRSRLYCEAIHWRN